MNTILYVAPVTDRTFVARLESLYFLLNDTDNHSPLLYLFCEKVLIQSGRIKRRKHCLSKKQKFSSTPVAKICGGRIIRLSPPSIISDHFCGNPTSNSTMFFTGNLSSGSISCHGTTVVILCSST